jgi:hypothetical protein
MDQRILIPYESEIVDPLWVTFHSRCCFVSVVNHVMVYIYIIQYNDCVIVYVNGHYITRYMYFMDNILLDKYLMDNVMVCNYVVSVDMFLC